jgi:hypothetical protein
MHGTVLPGAAERHWARRMKPTELSHTTDEDGDHIEEECYPCLARHEVRSQCRCGDCCRLLILEAHVEDAMVEPKIAEKGRPIYEAPELTASGTRELIGYLLNSSENGGPVRSWTGGRTSARSTKRGRSCAGSCSIREFCVELGRCATVSTDRTFV